MTQIGHFAYGDLEYLVAHDNTVLLELDDVKWSVKQPKAPGGTGLGRPKNTYHKVTGPAEGTWSISRKALQKSEKGELFMNLIRGAGILITEYITVSSSTYTPGQTLTSVISIKLRTSGTVLSTPADYSVNWSTGVITFTAATAEAADIIYLSTDVDWLGPNLIENGGIEAAIADYFTAVSCTAAQAAASVYVGTYGLALTAINAANDGVMYTPNISVVPGRTYKLSFWAKAAAADACAAKWTDAGGSVAMTPVGAAATYSTAWKLHEFTFAPDEATILDIQILNTTASPGATLDLDEIKLRESAPVIDLMDAGLYTGFEFEIIERRVTDHVVTARMKQCQVYSDSIGSGEEYKEDLEGQFLGLTLEE